MVQEVDHSQEVEYSVRSVENASKHMMLKRNAPWDYVATLLYAVIPCVGMALFDKWIMVHETIGMRRMGVG